MATIARSGIDRGAQLLAQADEAWRSVAAIATGWSRQNGIALRDAVVLVPFVQLLPLARSAFAATGGWMPRIETTRTFAAGLGPPQPAAAGAPSLDPALDRMLARQMLSRQSWAAAWRRNDQRGFERAAAQIVATCHALLLASTRVPPSSRDAWWATAREQLRVGAGPAARERGLAQIALEWAALAGPSTTDRLFSAAPSAWISVQAGGADPLVATLLDAASVPCLIIETDAAADAPFDLVGAQNAPALAVCASFEDEAEAAAAQIFEHLRRNERPVALIAQDRVLVRRVRALLERAGTSLLDETGWKLSTTRAAAALMTMLVAAQPDASADAFFEWLKSGTRWTRQSPSGVAALEAQSRRKSAWRLDAIARLELGHAGAEAVRHEAMATLAPLRDASRHPLAAWLGLCREALHDAGALADLQADAAGQQLISLLGLDGDVAAPGHAAALEPLSLADFTQWVDEALEAATFRADRDAADRAAFDEVDVVVTPLARAMLRPFAAAVMPGADDSRLGAFTADDSLLSHVARDSLGVPGPPQRAESELLAFAQLLRVADITLLHRRADGAESLATSPLVECLSLALAGQGACLRDWIDPRVEVSVMAAPIGRGSVAAPSLVPDRISATSYEALRSCPYRFFARSMLALATDDELDGDLEKRDYGNWLHQVLHLFHTERAVPHQTIAADETALRTAGDATLASLGFDAAEFLPWSASFEAFVPRYVHWLRDREAGGARWSGGEVELRMRPPELEGVELYGWIDRIDERGQGTQSSLELIDYKTGGATGLRDRVNDPAEDTQLAFYAALVGNGDDRPVKATYLALESRPDLKELEHPNVRDSAAALIEGVAIDLRRLRNGTGLLPLGEGDACVYCDARGLCRRDHWSGDAASESKIE